MQTLAAAPKPTTAAPEPTTAVELLVRPPQAVTTSTPDTPGVAARLTCTFHLPKTRLNVVVAPQQQHHFPPAASLPDQNFTTVVGGL